MIWRQARTLRLWLCVTLNAESTTPFVDVRAENLNPENLSKRFYQLFFQRFRKTRTIVFFSTQNLALLLQFEFKKIIRCLAISLTLRLERGRPLRVCEYYSKKSVWNTLREAATGSLLGDEPYHRCLYSDVMG